MGIFTTHLPGPMRASIALAAALLVAPALVAACQSMGPAAFEKSPARVKAYFDDAQFVVIANVAAVRTTWKCGRANSSGASSDFCFDETEHATFRVERVFKGTLKPGATFDITSGVTSCGRGIRHDDWIMFDPSRPAGTPAGYPRRWLIYYTAPEPGPTSMPFEISFAPQTMPVAMALYDVAVLKRFSTTWSRGPWKRTPTK